MKQTVFTGEYIHHRIDSLKEKVRELNQAIDELDDGYARDVLNEALQTAGKELETLSLTKYVESGD